MSEYCDAHSVGFSSSRGWGHRLVSRATRSSESALGGHTSLESGFHTGVEVGVV